MSSPQPPHHFETIPEDAVSDPVSSSSMRYGSSDHLHTYNNNNNNNGNNPHNFGHKQLSVVSTQYDIGNKGYLTPAEQHLRRMDTEGHGQLTNEQVSKIVEQTMSLRHINNRLQFWLCALFGAVIALALTNLGTSFWAAKMAKDTSVNSDTGVMTVKGSDQAVVTVSSGISRSVPVYYDEETGEEYMCIEIEEFGKMMKQSMDGTKISLVLESQDLTRTSTRTMGLMADGTRYNQDEACIGTADGGLCTSRVDRCNFVNGRRSRRLLHDLQYRYQLHLIRQTAREREYPFPEYDSIIRQKEDSGGDDRRHRQLQVGCPYDENSECENVGDCSFKLTYYPAPVLWIMMGDEYDVHCEYTCMKESASCENPATGTQCLGTSCITATSGGNTSTVSSTSAPTST